MATAAQRVPDQVFATLLEALLAGRYEPGEKLPPQRVLAADLGVAMGSLREALERLQQMGLVEVRHGDAMRVRDWREHGGLDVIAHLLLRSGGLDRAVLGDILDARREMLAVLGRLAAERRSAAQAQRLTRLAQAFAAAPDDAAAQEVDFAFMTELAQAAGNLVFVLIMNSIRALYFEHAALLPLAARHEELAPAYVAVAGAIEAGDGRAAGRELTALAEAHRRRIEEALG